MPKKPNLLLRLALSWKVLLILSILAIGGSGTFAAAVLLGLPGTPNCPSIFWPLASASMRFECARIAANKRTPKDLLEAIALLESLPSNHAMRAEADRLIEQWSAEVLDLAEESFNRGDLKEAIDSARRIPKKVSAYRLVEERVKRWETIWKKAETIYQSAENALRKRQWRRAFDQAVRLLAIDNQFWQTTKYDELTERINLARKDGDKLYEAERLADTGGLDNLLEGLKLAESINSKSYVYQEAQKIIAKIGRDLLNLAQYRLDQRDLSTAQRILTRVSKIDSLKEEARDLTTLANARSESWKGTIAGLEDAISQAQRIGQNRPYYKRAQQLIARWQMEMEGLAQLDKARTVAGAGSISELSQAIAEASRVKSSNPRREEVDRQISEWNRQIQVTEDQPILDQADQLASQGDPNSLQAAINIASQIPRGRALYGEAQTKIQTWTWQIQRTQNQPYLDQAQQYANAGDLTNAIQIAAQIPPGEALYREAQTSIKQWQQTIQAEAVRAKAEQTLQEARQIANSGSVDALASAIQVANQVPNSSNLRSEANAAISQWSWQLYQQAESRAGSDLPGAIAIAQRIPAGSPAYPQAQQQIQAWMKLLNPQ